MDIDTQAPLVTCDWCKKDFPPDAHAFSEGGIDMFEVPDDTEAWKGETPVEGVPRDQVRDVDIARMKAEMDLTDDQVKELLETGKVRMFICVCPTCREEASSDDNEP